MSDFILHDLVQGSPEWHDFRANHFTASDCPAMMGVSPYKTRTDLLKEKATGVTDDVDAATQRLFDDGHRFEALARPLAEAFIGDDLYPVVCSDGKLAASFDGLTLCKAINFEHKTLNAAIEACPTADDLPVMSRYQVQQQMCVSGAQKTLFMATRWDENGHLVAKREFWVERDEALITAIKLGWEQFEKDVADYVPADAVEKPIGSAVLDLPAVMVNVSGQIAVTDNLDKFTHALKLFVDDQLIRAPKTDQDFADLENQIKMLKKAEEALDSAEAHMLSQVDSVDMAKRMIDMARKIARDNRLMAEKLIKTEKENIKQAVVMNARKVFMDHLQSLNAEIAPVRIEDISPDFNGAARNKRTMESLRNSTDTELARVKIEADVQARAIRGNLAHLSGHEKYRFLFSDLATIAHKAPDDFSDLVRHRIGEHISAEAAKKEEERQRIRVEEESKARAKIEEEQREAAEEVERQNADIQRGAQQLIDSETHPAQEAIDAAAGPSNKIETTLVIRSSFKKEFIRKMVADSLEKYGIAVDSVEIGGSV